MQACELRGGCIRIASFGFELTAAMTRGSCGLAIGWPYLLAHFIKATWRVYGGLG